MNSRNENLPSAYHLFFIRRDLENRKLRNPRFSLRAYSRFLKIDAAAMSRILNGKQDLSVKACRDVLARLTDDPAERHRLLESVLDSRKAAALWGARDRTVESPDRVGAGVPEDGEIPSNWRAPLLATLERAGEEGVSIPEIALRLSTSEVHSAWLLDQLLRSERVRSESGRFYASPGPAAGGGFAPDTTANASVTPNWKKSFSLPPSVLPEFLRLLEDSMEKIRRELRIHAEISPDSRAFDAQIGVEVELRSFA